MNIRESARRFKRWLVKKWEKLPLKFKTEGNEFTVEVGNEPFDPRDDEQDGKVLLVTVEGQDTRVNEVNKKGDSLTLEYEDKTMAITSKPLLVGNTQIYFTKDGFLGTMALNKDTLLAGDVYQPSLKGTERKISKEVDETVIPVNLEEKAIRETEDYYVLESDDVGDVAVLHGSKAHLKEKNKAERESQLLKPSNIDKKRLLMALGAGALAGFYAYPQVNEGAIMIPLMWRNAKMQFNAGWNN